MGGPPDSSLEEYSPFFHLSRIFGTKDDHLLFGKVDRDTRRRGHASGVSVCREAASVIDHVVGMEMFQLFPRGPDKHVSHEEGMVGSGTDDSDVDSVALVPASKAIDNVDTISGVEIIDSSLTVDFPDLHVDSQRIFTD